MARKIEVGAIGVAGLLLVGHSLLSNPEETKKSASDGVDIVATVAEDLKDRSLDAAGGEGTTATSVVFVPAPVAGG